MSRHNDEIVSVWVIRGASVVLLSSAILKATYPEHSAMMLVAYSLEMPLSYVLIPSEIFLAMMLIHRQRIAATLRTTSGIFGVFAIYSLYRAISGAESCGCFGRISVNPWITFSLDVCLTILCFIAAGYYSSLARIALPKGSRLKVALVSFLATAIPVTILAYARTPLVDASAAALRESSGVVILQPEKWVGKAFPLDELLQPIIDVSRGRWTVLLFHHHCPKCEEVIPKYMALAERISDVKSATNVLFVEIPPTNSQPPNYEPAVHVVLPGNRAWFAESPMEIGLKDGLVMYASGEMPSLNRKRPPAPLVEGR